MKVFAVGTKSFSDSNFRETLLRTGQKFTVEWPNRIFVTLVSGKVGPSGDFSLEYFYSKGDRHTPIRVSDLINPGSQVLEVKLRERGGA